jgi:outer membrane protein assembly factor BamB
VNVDGSRDRCAAALCGLLVGAWALAAPPVSPAAGPTVGFRGDATGRFPDATPPTTWSKTDNIVWKTKLPKSSYSSVTLSGDRLFVASEPTELLALRADTGEILWQRSHTWEYAVGPELAARIAADHAAAQALEPEIKDAQKSLSELQKTDGTPKAKIEDAKKKLDAIRAKQDALQAYPRIPGGSGNTAATAVSDGRTVYASFGQGIVSAHTLDVT